MSRRCFQFRQDRPLSELRVIKRRIAALKTLSLKMPANEQEAQRGDARRAETRRKIQLGGLVIKAGLAGVPPALILGILMDGAARLANEPETARLKRLGHLALVGEPE